MRNPDFRRFWFSSILAQFGAQITLLALPICAVLMLHATPAQMGTLAAFESLPFLLSGLPSAVLLDRSRRLPVMMCSDAVVAPMRALTVAAAPLGALLAGALGEGFGVREGLGCIAAGAVLLAAGGVFGTRLKEAKE